MRAFLRDPEKRGWTLIVILVALAILLIGPFMWNADARHLSAFRDGAEDASLARDAFDGRAARLDAMLSTPHDLADIKEPQRTLLVILGVERRYSESETQAIVDYVRRGGNLILADEGGYGTDIAREAGFGFAGDSLLDTRNHLGDPTLLWTHARLDGRDYRVLFNAPTALRPLSNAGPFEVLAASSAASYPDGSFLDTNQNGEIDINDAASPTGEGLPLIVRTRLGDGTLILASDTGLFMNGQLGLVEYENAGFIGALAGTLVPRDGRILLDEARHAPPAPIALYSNTIRAVGQATSGPIAPFLTLLIVALATLGGWFSTRETDDWSHHDHNLGAHVNVPEELRPDLDRAQRMAQRRISEKFNIAVEQVAAMTADELLRLTGERMLSEAAAGTLKSDPAPLFHSFSRPEARSE